MKLFGRRLQRRLVVTDVHPNPDVPEGPPVYSLTSITYDGPSLEEGTVIEVISQPKRKDPK